ncbi:MAG TPA: hypothetical protein VHG72_21255, partial [Polyangia bacterium]|nr:hypothetical protein [Polyangia bacterium]
ISEYMNGEFGDAARRHRTLLSEHLAKESTSRRELAAPALVERSGSTVNTKIENGLRTRRRRAPLAFAIITLLAVMCIASSSVIVA